MTVFEAIQQRYSVRRYNGQAVEPEKLARVLEAARLAPSAGNRQEWRFVVVTDEQTRQELMKAAADQGFVGQAPVVIAACAETDEYTMPCGQLSYPIDVAIALEHIALQAVAEGLGTCWVGAFDEAAAKQILDIPQEVPVVELMALGYPADEPRPRQRLELDETVFCKKWGRQRDQAG